MKALRQYASALLAKKILTLPRKAMRATEYLDDGAALNVCIQRKGTTLQIDFTGSAAVHEGNLNATKAIVQSVVLYCLRLLINQPLPMNEGLMEQVSLTLPHGLLNPDFTHRPLPAVVGGNTEVSQRLTDTILKALGLAACSQGTMNNLLFGNDRFGYYETMCGGTGASHGSNGADAVHQHMTNTRITDPEVLEFRYPVKLLSFEIRKRSGGKGKWSGGDGVVRQLQFLEELEVNLLTQHRKQMPYGVDGGKPGKTGEQFLLRSTGKKEKLSGVDGAHIFPGDTIVVATPGGGGWGQQKEK
jgi:5-oxoprolinase (ATP-hydrolysing)